MPNTAEQAIYNRLASAPLFHPSTASFVENDWALEPGDVVTVNSGEDSYSVPVYSLTFDWMGSNQNGSCASTTTRVSIESTGGQTREPLPELKREQFAQDRANYSYQRTNNAKQEQEFKKYDTKFTKTDQKFSWLATESEWNELSQSGHVTALTNLDRTARYVLDTAKKELPFDDWKVQWLIAHPEDKNLNDDELREKYNEWIAANPYAIYNTEYSDATRTGRIISKTGINELGENETVLSRIVEEADRVESSIYTSQSNVYNAISRTASDLRVEIGDTEQGLYNYINLTASGLRQQLTNYSNRTIVNDTDPRGDTYTPKDGDIWIESTYQGSWDGAEGFDWEHDEQYDWTQVQGAKVWTWKNNRWQLVADRQQLVTYSDFQNTADQLISQKITELANEQGQIEVYRSLIDQTGEQIRTEVYSATSTIYSYIHQTASGIEQSTGRRPTVIVQDMIADGEPTKVNGRDPVENDLWIDSANQETWDKALAKNWAEDVDYSWNDLRSDKIKVYKDGEWKLVEDGTILLDEGFRDQVDGTFQEISRKIVAVEGQATEYYAKSQQQADHYYRTMQDRTNNLGSRIDQTTTEIRSEVHAANSTIYSSIVQTASEISFSVHNRPTVMVWDVTKNGEPTKVNGRDPVENDMMIDSANQKSWDKALEVSWDEDWDYNWNDLRSDKIKVYKDGEWQLVEDGTILLDDTFRGEVDGAIQDIARKIVVVQGQATEYYAKSQEQAELFYRVMQDRTNDLGSRISQSASEIRSEVHAANSTVYTSITQTASQIRSEVVDAKRGLQSSITEQADRISLVVEGTGSNAHIKPASIVAAINEQEGESQVLIEANKVAVAATDLAVWGVFTDNTLTGGVVAEKLNSSTNTYVKGDQVYIGDVTFDYQRVYPTASTNPAAMDYFESAGGGAYKLTKDITPVSGKAYYKRSIKTGTNADDKFTAVDNLIANKVDTNYLTANYTTTTNLEANYTKTTDLEAAYATIKSLNTEKGRIDNLISGSTQAAKLWAVDVLANNVSVGSSASGDMYYRGKKLTSAWLLNYNGTKKYPVLTIDGMNDSQPSGYSELGNAIASISKNNNAPDGQIGFNYTTLDGTSGTVNFSIADTQFYKDGVSAAWDDASSKTVAPSAAAENTEVKSFIFKAPTTTTAQDGTATRAQTDFTFTLSKGTPSASGGYASVSYGGRAVGRIAIGDWYTAGETAGKNAVTINKGAWNAGKIDFTKSEGTASTKSVSLSVTATQKVSTDPNKWAITIKDGNADTGASTEVDASSRYTAGKNSVTISNSDIVREDDDYYNPSTHNTTIYIEATASNGAQGTQSFTVSGADAYAAGKAASTFDISKLSINLGSDYDATAQTPTKTADRISGKIGIWYDGTYIGELRTFSFSIDHGTPYIGNPAAGYVRGAVSINGETITGNSVKLTESRISGWGGPIS